MDSQVLRGGQRSGLVMSQDSWRPPSSVQKLAAMGISVCGRLAVYLTVLLATSPVVAAEEDEPVAVAVAVTSRSLSAEEQERRSSAVALNYSRAALHRIRRNPSVRVLNEEQDKILNHLNLNGIADEDVMKLYTAVLDEIGQVRLGDRERALLHERYTRFFRRDVTVNALSLMAQVATAQFGQAVRTGANSWWDFRTQSQNRELDIFRVEKEQLTRLMDKSGRFLDVSWKMARQKQIPDRWLVRGDDLDKLEEAWREPDATVRLRVLKRMEPFMECYPPYWYYVARTQQAQGQMRAAVETYGRLVQLGEGHFRKDEMLAAGLANQALIQAFLTIPNAADAAEQALVYSTDVWEANLICASVLTRARRFAIAEDAILRNLDVGLEKTQSQTALVSLYFASDDRGKLAAWLSDPLVVRDLPPGALVLCAAKLGPEQTPTAVVQTLQRSLQLVPRYNLGRDDVLVQASTTWNLPQAALSLQIGEQIFEQPRLQTQAQFMQAAFEGIAEFSANNGPAEPRDLTLTIAYPDSPAVRVTWQFVADGQADATGLNFSGRRSASYRLTAIEHDRVKLSVAGNAFRVLSGQATLTDIVPVPAVSEAERPRLIPTSAPTVGSGAAPINGAAPAGRSGTPPTSEPAAATVLKPVWDGSSPATGIDPRKGPAFGNTRASDSGTLLTPPISIPAVAPGSR